MKKLRIIGFPVFLFFAIENIGAVTGSVLYVIMKEFIINLIPNINQIVYVLIGLAILISIVIPINIAFNAINSNIKLAKKNHRKIFSIFGLISLIISAALVKITLIYASISFSTDPPWALDILGVWAIISSFVLWFFREATVWPDVRTK